MHLNYPHQPYVVDRSSFLSTILVSFRHLLSAYLYQRYHPVMTAAKRGMVTAQYNQKHLDTRIPLGPAESVCQSNMLILKSEATYVPGKNSAAMNVNVIIAILSLVSDAILIFNWLSARARSFCVFAMRLYSKALALSLWLAALESWTKC